MNDDNLNLIELLFRLSGSLNESKRKVSLTVNENAIIVIGVPDKNGTGFMRYSIEPSDLTKTTDQLYNEIMEHQ